MANAKIPYDWVIVQAGGNDLAWNNTPEKIFEKMQAVWEIALKAGAKIMALTVTEHAGASIPMKEKWEILNRLISHHHQDGFYTADVAKAIPWTGMSQDDRQRIWDDGVHLKKIGYQLMGDTIADRLIEIVKEPSRLWYDLFRPAQANPREVERESKI